MENKLTPELIEKAKLAKSPEEILALAKENGAEITEESAKAYFDQLHKTGELTDDELDSVAGGGCRAKDGRLVVTVYHDCNYFCCKKCGGAKKFGLYSNSCGDCGQLVACQNCKHCSYENGLWLCNNPKNNK